MGSAIESIVTWFATTLLNFIKAIFGGLGSGVQELFLTTNGDSTVPSAFAYISFMFIALSLAVGLTHWITNWIRGRLG